MNLHFTLPHSPGFILDYLSDPVKFVRVHPLIHRMDPAGSQEYTVYEKTKLLGWIPYTFSYRAFIQSDAVSGTVHIRAVIQGMVRIRMDFQISPSESGSIVDEQVEIQSVLPVGPFMYPLIRKTHQKMFDRIAAADIISARTP